MPDRFLIVTIVLELGARLSLLGSAWSLFASAGSLATTAALAAWAGLFSILRTLWRAGILRGHIADLYGRLVRGVARKSTPSLLANREHAQTGSLVDAIYEVASVRAVAVPDAIGAGTGVLVVLGMTAIRLGPFWLALGAALAGAVVLCFAPARRAARRARERGFRAHVRSARGLEALVFGAAELRASGAEGAGSASVERDGQAFAIAERAGVRLSAATGALPALLALALVALPADWVRLLSNGRGGEVAVLAGAGAAYALGLVSSLDAIARSTPVRETLYGFIGHEEPAGVPLVDPAVGDDSPPIHRLELDGVSIRHEGAERDTPAGLSLTLRGGGLALVGPNGCGKTTTLLALVGLVPVRTGRVLVNGACPEPSQWAAIRARSLLIPQRPYIAADESIAWHVGLFGTRPPDLERLEAALKRLGLGSLAQRAGARGIRIADLPMGELSGGEQRRATFARALLSDRDLVLVDEPEAALDAEGREVVKNLLSELARDRLVVLVAHDGAIVPAGFQRVTLGT